MKRYFDALVVVPLSEEFEACLNHFDVEEDLTAGDQIRLATKVTGSAVTVLVVQQGDMGKTENVRACREAISDYEFGILICVGIGGGLAKDVNIGDVCFTKDLVDVLDNAKISDKDGKTTVSLSPKHYETPREFVNVFVLNRVLPDSRPDYEAWRESRCEAGRQLLPGTFTGKEGKAEFLQPPSARDGLIACGSVSGSPAYNDAVKGVDRRVLAIETESGGMFEIAKQHNLPAMAVRGISDYAGIDKTRFETETQNQARGIAAANAMSYLALQLSSARMRGCLDRRKAVDIRLSPELPLSSPPAKDAIASALEEQREAIDGKLRELASGYELLQKGYRLPVPRIRIEENKGISARAKLSNPIEIRDALRQSKILTVSVPKEYPEESLAWIIASDLLTTEIGQKIAIPIVIEAGNLQRPRTGFRELRGATLSVLVDNPSVQLVYIVNDVQFSKKTRVQFLAQQIRENPGAAVIVVSRSERNLIAESDFNNSVKSESAYLCEISFSEITNFIRLNYEMTLPASEVLAAQLWDLFHSFQMPAHPAYFAGIPRSLLNDVLRANRRAELIELAVAGYLSIVVSEDQAAVQLSRTTREKFLTDLAFDINVEKRQFTELDLVSRAETLAKQKDFAVSPSALVASFFEKGILHYVDGRVSFTLGFIETFLLARRLKDLPSVAANYFDVRSADFDDATFTLYAELGVTPVLLGDIDYALDESIKALDRGHERVLVGDKVKPSLLVRKGDSEKLQKNIESAINDVRNERETTAEKQRLLDAAERVQESLSEKKAEAKATAGDRESIEFRAMSAWNITSILLGAGAEQLDADVKRSLAAKLIRLTVEIVEDWTREAAKIDYSDLRSELLKDDDFIRSISRSNSKNDRKDANKLIDMLVDAWEFITVTEPFGTMAGQLCAQARDKVLAESVANLQLTDELEVLFQNLWLADLDTPRGKSRLDQSIKHLKSSRLLRVALTNHLVLRAFWHTSQKNDRHLLLDSANESLKVIGRSLPTQELERLTDEAAAELRPAKTGN